jgi:hypothetical protein
MALADLIQQNTLRESPGKLDRILEDLAPEDRADFENALTNKRIPIAAIGRALRALGHDIGDERIRLARRERIQ